jgi:hypothetical protein
VLQILIAGCTTVLARCTGSVLGATERSDAGGRQDHSWNTHLLFSKKCATFQSCRSVCRSSCILAVNENLRPPVAPALASTWDNTGSDALLGCPTNIPASYLSTELCCGNGERYFAYTYRHKMVSRHWVSTGSAGPHCSCATRCRKDTHKNQDCVAYHTWQPPTGCSVCT